MQRFVKTLRLKDDAELIRQYKEIHDNIWPEIKEGISSVGITGMELYILGNLAVMIVEMDDTLDPDDVFNRLATYPRQQEWEEYVARFQQCGESDTSAVKWQPMERIFKL